MLERAIWTEQREGASLEIIGRRGDAVNETGPIGIRWKEETDRQTDEPTKRELFGQLKGDSQPAVTCRRRTTVPERRTGAS